MINIEEFESKGMFFDKALVGPNLTIEQSEKCILFCQYIRSLKATHPDKYESWLRYILSVLQAESLSKTLCLKFINEYIVGSLFENGEPNQVCVSNNYNDISNFRKILTVFNQKIVEPRRSKAVH